MERTGIAAVGVAQPEMMGDIGIAVHVIPSAVDEHAMVIHAGVPFVGLMEADANDIATIRFHGMHGVDRTMSTATQIPAAAFGNEHYTPVRKRTRIKIIERTVGKLLQA